MPLIPTTLSVRTLDQLTEFIADFDGERPDILAFFSMIDRRKRLHREIAEQLPGAAIDVAATAIPALSLIEQMSRAARAGDRVRAAQRRSPQLRRAVGGGTQARRAAARAKARLTGPVSRARAGSRSSPR